MTVMSPRAYKTRTAATIRGESTRDGILAVASKLFAEKGFAGTALQDIAEKMGITRAAVYHHFKSKDEVLATLVADNVRSGR